MRSDNRKILRVGDRVYVKDTGFKGEIIGAAITMMLFNSDEQNQTPTAMVFGKQFVVRLLEPFIVTEFDEVVRGEAPSKYPGCLFVYEIVKNEEELEEWK